MSRPNTERVFAVCPARQVTQQSVSWFWQDRLPWGRPVLLDGDGNEGKSLVSLDLAARLTTGRPMPDGAPSPGVGDVLILQEEDSTEDTVCPRLAALGADLDRVSFLTSSADDPEPLRIPTELAALDRAIRDTDARLVIIDPLYSFLDRSVLAGDERSIRRAFRPLHRLARDRDCVILMIRHLTKQHRSRALYRGIGGMAMINSCRSAWLVGRDPYDRERRVLAEQKMNIAHAQPSLAFRIQGTGQAAVIEWLGPTELLADHLVGAAASPSLIRACEFLGEFLKDGPRLRPDVMAAAARCGIAERTLNRARKHLKGQSRTLTRNHIRYTYWLLQGQCIPLSPDGKPNDFDQLLQEMERQRAGLNAKKEEEPQMNTDETQMHHGCTDDE